MNHPELDAAVARIAAAGRKHNKILGRPGLTAEDIQRHTEEGFRFFMSLTEWELMVAGARQLLDPLGTGAAR